MSTSQPIAPTRRRAAGARNAAREDARAERGASARDQLVAHATRIFSVKGYAGASTREICDAAGVNVASIHYYFGDKAGLYRAVLLEPITRITGRFGGFDDPSLSFEDSMRRFLSPFVPSSDEAGEERALMRLHLREMLEPSGVFREVVERNIVPHHNALAELLARHVGITRPDEGIHQLAFALVAMANDYCMSREFMNLLAPRVLNRPDAKAQVLDRLVGYSAALLQYEIERRGGNGKAAPRGRGNGAAARPRKAVARSR
jgi:AcrR family transcriptional regulator